MAITTFQNSLLIHLKRASFAHTRLDVVFGETLPAKASFKIEIFETRRDHFKDRSALVQIIYLLHFPCNILVRSY